MFLGTSPFNHTQLSIDVGFQNLLPTSSSYEAAQSHFEMSKSQGKVKRERKLSDSESSQAPKEAGETVSSLLKALPLF